MHAIVELIQLGDGRYAVTKDGAAVGEVWRELVHIPALGGYEHRWGAAGPDGTVPPSLLTRRMAVDTLTGAAAAYTTVESPQA